MKLSQCFHFLQLLSLNDSYTFTHYHGFSLGQNLVVGGQIFFSEYPKFLREGTQTGWGGGVGGGDSIFVGFFIQNVGPFEEKVEKSSTKTGYLTKMMGILNFFPKKPQNL